MRLLAVLASAATLFVGCASEHQPTDPSQPAASLAELGTVRFTMDGYRVVLPASATRDSSNTLAVFASDTPNFVLTFSSPATVGLRSILQPGLSAAIYSNGAVNWTVSTPIATAAGSVKVETLTPGVVTGRFALILVPIQQALGEKVISDGVFNLPLTIVN